MKNKKKSLKINLTSLNRILSFLGLDSALKQKEIEELLKLVKKKRKLSMLHVSYFAFTFYSETQYQKQDFENLNMQGLNLFGVPLDQDQN